MKKILLLLLLLLISCTPLPNISTKENYNYHSDVIEQVQQPKFPAVNNEVLNFSNDYRDLSFIRVYGVDKQRITDIVYTINSSYFNGLRELEVVFSSRQATKDSRDGFYYPDSGKISIYMTYEGNSYVRELLVHELKHHYCWIHMKEINLDHQGCFLTAPVK